MTRGLRSRLIAVASSVAVCALCGAQQLGSQPAPAAARAPGAAAAPLAASPAASAAPVYNVEVVVFRALTTVGGPEDWNLESGPGAASSGSDTDTTAPAAAASGAAPEGAPGLVRTLPAADFQLGDVEARLRASGSYVPVAHAAWSQTATAWGVRAGIGLQRVGLDAAGLTGSIALERGQFLHLDLRLSYAIAAPAAGLEAAPNTVFTLQESQRVRFYERNYFDNPAFGVIALITPAQGGRRAGR
jgi:hypothetical protein